MFPENLHTGTVSFLLLLGIMFILSGFDDLIIDLIAIFNNLKPKRLNSSKIMGLNKLKEKKIAVMIPAWKEAGIIGRMIEGNLKNVEYSVYSYFIGVYPNDLETVEEVRKLSEKYSNVFCVVNHKHGPTTKGQMLNCVVKEIMKPNYGEAFAAIHMQDAEDIMHPKILKLVNKELEGFDFIQTPVFSLKNKWNHFVGGTYMDEFAESHTKDMLVREKLNAAIPSAGVGTTISNRILIDFKNKGVDLFNESSLTEDYELGLICKAWGFKSHFSSCYYIDNKNGKKDYIATREYFPNLFRASIKQKTRWTIGIGLQGWKNLKWHGSFFNRYFLYRDRKGSFTNTLVIIGYCIFLLLSSLWLYSRNYSYELNTFINSIFDNEYLNAIFYVNLFLMFNRFIQRTRCSYSIYGFLASLLVVFRWPVGCLINGFASMNGVLKYASALKTGKALSWSKTTHRLPEEFTQTNMTNKVRVG